MRQTRAVWVTVGVAVALAAVLVAYGLMRSGGHHSRHEPMMDSQGQHGAAAIMEGAGEHAGHAESRGDQRAPSLSGRVENAVRVVRVAARQFEFDPARIIVRQGEKVRLEVTSEDVTHGIAIEDYGIDRKLPPGKTEVIEFSADKAGTHHFHCSVYCGAGHRDMHGELVVLAGAG